MIKFVTTEDLQDQSMLYGSGTNSVLINRVKEFLSYWDIDTKTAHLFAL